MKKTLLLTIILFAAFGLSGCNYNSLTAGQQGIKGNGQTLKVRCSGGRI